MHLCRRRVVRTYAESGRGSQRVCVSLFTLTMSDACSAVARTRRAILVQGGRTNACTNVARTSLERRSDIARTFLERSAMEKLFFDTRTAAQPCPVGNSREYLPDEAPHAPASRDRSLAAGGPREGPSESRPRPPASSPTHWSQLAPVSASGGVPTRSVSSATVSSSPQGGMTSRV